MLNSHICRASSWSSCKYLASFSQYIYINTQKSSHNLTISEGVEITSFLICDMPETFFQEVQVII